MTDKKVVFLKYDNYIKIIHSKTYDSAKPLDFYLNQFDINEYYIYKCTKQQYEVTIEDLYDFKYSGYIFFKKDKYDNKIIDKSIELINKKMCMGFMYLNKPLPPLEIIEKIKVIL